MAAKGILITRRNRLGRRLRRRHVAAAARLERVSRLIFPSSGTVYLSSLGAGVKQIDQSIPMNPPSVYAATKASCEFMGRAYAKRYGFEFICLRYTGGLYSPSRYCPSDSHGFSWLQYRDQKGEQSHAFS